MSDPRGITDRMASSITAAADPKTRAKLLKGVRRPLHEEITAAHGHILAVAPTVHMLPFAPQQGKEKDVKKVLQEASEWLRKEHEVYDFFLYELVGHRGGGDQASPQFLLILVCDDKDVMQRLKSSPSGKKLQENLIGLCRGATGRDEGEFGINSLLLGLV